MRIKRLKINNFRLFKEKEIIFDNDMTVIVGPNARGKSTIIEAIHMISTGNSPWTSDNLAVVRQEKKNISSAGRIEADIECEDESKNVCIVIKSNNGSTIKEFRINGKPATKTKFIQLLNSIIFSPDLIDILMFEPKQRRRFLDSYISKIDIEYDDVTDQYEKALKHRNSLLRFLAKKNIILEADKRNLKFWTGKIIDLGTIITVKRLDFVEQLNEVDPKLYPNTIKYKPSLNISEIELLADIDYVKRVFEEKLKKTFKKELILGLTLTGPHRDDWTLEHKGKNLNKFGSRGEKRMAIADIAFKMNQILIQQYQAEPIILLDDISSELDEKNIRRLLKEKIKPDQQTILTTVDISELKQITPKSPQIIKLK